jgi:hypothetical protein
LDRLLCCSACLPWPWQRMRARHGLVKPLLCTVPKEPIRLRALTLLLTVGGDGVPLEAALQKFPKVCLVSQAKYLLIRLSAGSCVLLCSVVRALLRVQTSLCGCLHSRQRDRSVWNLCGRWKQNNIACHCAGFVAVNCDRPENKELCAGVVRRLAKHPQLFTTSPWYRTASPR